MGYPHDLLEAAHSFLLVEPLTQAILRRTVSTAYYALFHLLIEDACGLWGEPDHRGRLSRQFDHKRMKEASAATAKTCVKGTELWVVSNTFVFLQHQRHEADYNLARIVSPLDVVECLGGARVAFQSWSRIREQPPARDYLFALLFRDKS
jgi:hypothetical protein